jgi:hypothetical protein
MSERNMGKFETEELELKKLSEIIDCLLDRRIIKKKDGDYENELWSFRGQRDEQYDLGYMYDSIALAGYEKKFKQYMVRVKEFKKPDYLEETDSWRWLFSARHQNLNARLLDWTSNPLVAVYFAVENIISRKNDNTQGAVWALRVGEDNFHPADTLTDKYGDPKKPLIDKLGTGKELKTEDWFMINPEPVSHRIVRQSGKFSFHPGDNIKPINKLPRRDGEELLKIKITGDIELIRMQLGVINIHHASLFPDEAGVSEFVNYEWPKIGKY